MVVESRICCVRCVIIDEYDVDKVQPEHCVDDNTMRKRWDRNSFILVKEDQVRNMELPVGSWDCDLGILGELNYY